MSLVSKEVKTLDLIIFSFLSSIEPFFGPTINTLKNPPNATSQRFLPIISSTSLGLKTDKPPLIPKRPAVLSPHANRSPSLVTRAE